MFLHTDRGYINFLITFRNFSLKMVVRTRVKFQFKRNRQQEWVDSVVFKNYTYKQFFPGLSPLFY